MRVKGITAGLPVGCGACLARFNFYYYGDVRMRFKLTSIKRPSAETMALDTRAGLISALHFPFSKSCRFDLLLLGVFLTSTLDERLMARK